VFFLPSGELRRPKLCQCSGACSRRTNEAARPPTRTVCCSSSAFDAQQLDRIYRVVELRGETDDELGYLAAAEQASNGSLSTELGTEKLLRNGVTNAVPDKALIGPPTRAMAAASSRAGVPRIREEDERRTPVCVRNIAQPRFHSRCSSRSPPTTGVILEIANGSGEHIVHFARNFPTLIFQP
jgi:hypothetical protein